MFYVIKIFVFGIFHNNDYFLLYFYNNNFTLSKCCFENINININKSHASLCLTNNVFLFDQKENISLSSTPSSSITSYNLVIFYFVGTILSNIFHKKDNFNITKQLFPFLMYCFFFVLVQILYINQKIVI